MPRNLLLLPVLAATLVLAPGFVAAQGPAPAQTRPLDPANRDTTCSACEDFYRWANGGWIKATPIPAASVSRPGTTPQLPALDGLLVRGLYLFNSRQQAVVVDYVHNLVGSPWFAIDPNNQAKVIKPATPNETEWAFPYELRLDLKKPVPLP